MRVVGTIADTYEEPEELQTSYNTHLFMFSKSPFFLLVLVLLIVSCKKDDNEVINSAPLITAQTFSIEESSTGDTIVGMVIATDAQEDNLTFSLSSNPDNLFEISDDGEISLATNSVLDYETATSHVITVEVSDGSLSANTDITINVLDIFEQVPFISTWKTTTINEIITIPTDINLTYSYSVDWGDGTTSYNHTTDASHTYAKAGIYEVAITGDFPAILFQNFGDKDKIQSIKQWGSIEWQSMNRAFFGCTQLTYTAIDTPNLSSVTNTFSMFFGATSFNGDLNNWDVSKVTNMRSMFFGATSFNGNIGNWNVSNVTNTASMFLGATSFNQDLTNWNVSNVTDMSYMFQNATSFKGDISNWDVSSVELMELMFGSATSFNGDIGNWNVSNVVRMNKMFEEATSFSQDLSGWNTENVMLFACSEFSTGSGLTTAQLPTAGPCF